MNENCKIEKGISKKSWGNHLAGCQKKEMIQENTLKDSELVTKVCKYFSSAWYGTANLTTVFKFSVKNTF